MSSYDVVDHDDSVRIWQEGFLELALPSYYSARLPVTVVLLVLGCLFYSLRWLTILWIILGITAAWLSPFGSIAVRSLLWQAILSETRASMTRPTFQQKWLIPPHAFFVAHFEGRVVGCVAVRCANHTLSKERLGIAIREDTRDGPSGSFGGGNPTGDAGVPVTASAPPQFCASVWRLSVDKDFRRLGIARLLMSRAELHAASQGCTAVTLLTGNPSSKRFYECIGYKRETWEDASKVVFGKSGRPQNLLLIFDWIKWFALWYRVRVKGNIFRKRLSASEPSLRS